LVEFYNDTIADNASVEMVWYPREDEAAAEKWAAGHQFPWPTIRGKALEKVDPVKDHAGRGVPNYVLVSADNEVVAKGLAAAKAKISELNGE
jgi:hypothetical protein